MCLSPSSSETHTHIVIAVHCHRYIFVGVVVNNAALCLPSSEASQLSKDQVHRIKFPDVGSILSSIHALDQSANFIFASLLTILCE